MRRSKPDAPVPMGRHALSPSKIDALHCPYYYEQRYVKLREESNSPEMGVGRLCHEVGARYIQHLVDEQIQFGDITVLESIVDDVWDSRPGWVRPSEWEDYQECARSFQFRQFDSETIVAIEEPLAFAADWTPCEFSSEKCRYGGIPDLVELVDNVVVATDWTTAGLGAHFEAKKDMQLRFYAALLEREHRISDVRIKTVSLRTGGERELTLGKRDHESTRRWAEIEAVRLDRLLADGDDWPVQPGPLCDRCSFACPLDAEELDVPHRIGDPQTATHLTGLIYQQEARTAKAKKLLKQYVAVHGPVPANGVIAEPRIHASYWWPPAETRKLLIDLGYDPNEIGNFTSEAFRKHVKQEDHQAAIFDLAKKRNQERFGIYKERIG